MCEDVLDVKSGLKRTQAVRICPVLGVNIISVGAVWVNSMIVMVKFGTLVLNCSFHNAETFWPPSYH